MRKNLFKRIFVWLPSRSLRIVRGVARRQPDLVHRSNERLTIQSTVDTASTDAYTVHGVSSRCSGAGSTSLANTHGHS